MKQLLFISLLFVFNALSYSQNDRSEYLQAARKNYASGNYENAQKALNVYRNVYKGEADDLAQRIERCLLLTKQAEEATEKQLINNAINIYNEVLLINHDDPIVKEKIIKLKKTQIEQTPITVSVSHGKSTPFVCMDGIYGSPVFKNPRWRIGNDIINQITVYLNLFEDIYDKKIIIDDNRSIILNARPGDLITMVPDNDTFETTTVKVTEDNIRSQSMTVKIRKKNNGVIKGTIIDKTTQKALCMVNTSLSYVTFLDYLDMGDSDYRKSIDNTQSDDEGKFIFKNCIVDYLYHLSISTPLGYSYQSIDIRPQDCDSLVIQLSPTVFKGDIKHGKRPITNAIIECKTLYEQQIRTNDNGLFEISGYIGNQITIRAEGFKTLIIDVEPADSNRTLHISMDKGNPSDIINGEYDYNKKKVIKKK